MIVCLFIAPLVSGGANPLGDISRVSGVSEMNMLKFPLIACKLDKRIDLERVLIITNVLLPWGPCSRAMAPINRLEHLTFPEWFAEAALYMGEQ